MKLEIKDKKKSETFINIFNGLKSFTDRINLMFMPDKLHIQGMDASHICVYELFINKEWFSFWEVTQNETFGIILSSFNKVLHTCNSDKQNIIIHNNDLSDKISIEFISEDKGIFNKYFEMPLMDIDEDLLNIPECDYEVDITMDSKRFKTLTDELSHFSDTINIQCNEAEFAVEAIGDEGTMRVVISMDDIDSYTVIENEIIEISFGIRYINQICQFHKLTNICTIHISRGLPIQIKYIIDEDSMMRFYLAPKIDD